MTAVTLPGTGAAVAVDLIAAENHQLVKVEFGAAGVATQVSAANPFPISGPVTGTFFQATQPVSAASLPLPAGASTETTQALVNGKLPAFTTLWVSATAASGVAATASLPAVAGQFHYITAIDIQLYATAARVGAAAPVTVTTTNLPGAAAWPFPTAQAIGALDRYDVPLLTALKSSVANTITTIAAPIATTGIWRINVGYYTGT